MSQSFKQSQGYPPGDDIFNNIASAGAAGNFLAPISQLSSNGFKSVMDIDVLGSYNTLKATLPSLLKSAAKNEHDTKTGEQRP